jgi:hypothetical protein
MVDALDSGSSVSNDVEVQVLSSAPSFILPTPNSVRCYTRLDYSVSGSVRELVSKCIVLFISKTFMVHSTCK